MASIIVYFSRRDENYVNGTLKNLTVGNTEIAANMLQRLTGAELFKIEPIQEYSKGYNECIAQAKADRQRGARPELKEYPDSLEEYDAVYLGYPNYWGTMPMAVFTFLEHFDFNDKTIYPFCTHEGSGMGVSERDIAALCPGAKLEPGLAIRGGSVKNSEDAIKKWLQPDIKKLGFGLMRLPKKGDKIDIEQTKEMVDMFMEAGFTYFDTAWAYEGSEDAIRQALIERYPREKFQLATKNAAWINCKTREEAIAQFETSLKQTGAGYFDYYLLHNLGESRTKFFDDYDMWGFVQDKKKEGLIKHVGFSFHSTAEELEEILKEHPEMEFVQLQINYGDWNNPAIQSRACYEVARKYGKPIIVMEPVKGGMLATPPEQVARVLKKAEPDVSVASWAVRFAADLEGIITVLSGMSNVEQMRDNLSFMKNFTGLDENQKKTIAEAQKILQSIPLIPCTTCDYCSKVCPLDIGISGSFTAQNILTLYQNKEGAQHQEEWLVSGHGKKRATECIKCGECEKVCPQHISIREELERVSKTFGEEQSK